MTSTLPISQQLNFNKNCDTSRTLVRDYNSYNRILNRKQLLANNSLSHLLNQNRTLKLAARLVEKSPKQLQPFLKLSRLDKPIGSWLLFWPCGWSLCLATQAGNVPDLSLLAMFGAGSLVMRGAGCTINDMWDRNIDRQVERTRDRPITSGQVSIIIIIIINT